MVGYDHSCKIFVHDIAAFRYHLNHIGTNRVHLGMEFEAYYTITDVHK